MLFPSIEMATSGDIHPRIWAHLGDSVYELWLREQIFQRVLQGELSKIETVHTETTQRASAKFQVQLLQALAPLLNQEEQDIVRRGRNVPVAASRRSNQSLHRHSTGFEALVGYLYCHQPERLKTLFIHMADLLYPSKESPTTAEADIS